MSLALLNWRRWLIFVLKSFENGPELPGEG
jgi:hypothetical protein